MIVYKAFRVIGDMLCSYIWPSFTFYKPNESTWSNQKYLCFKRLEDALYFVRCNANKDFKCEIWECETSDESPKSMGSLISIPLYLSGMLTQESVKEFWDDPDKYTNSHPLAQLAATPLGTYAVSNIKPVRVLHRNLEGTRTWEEVAA